jgi:hypothetical protein
MKGRNGCVEGGREDVLAGDVAVVGIEPPPFETTCAGAFPAPETAACPDVVAGELTVPRGSSTLDGPEGLRSTW